MPDIIAQFAKMEGIPHVQYQSMLFADFIGALQSDRIDIVGDTMYNTIAREQEIAYPSPVFYDPGGMIVAKGNPLNLHSLSDLKSGMKLAVPEGSIYLTYAQNLVASGVQLTLLPVPGVSQQIAAVSSGQADAAINDAILYAYALKINPSLNLSIATPFAQPVVRSSTESDCTFPKGEPDLIAAWNADFNVMTKDGFVDKVLEEYGATPSLYVANPTDPDYTSS
jgi:polar amino acid transport system substrate-binding protein